MKSIKHLYVHIPFCRRKCPYCDFYSEITKNVDEENYLQLLLQEIKIRNIPIEPETVYFGGGTPSLLSPAFFEKFITQFKSNLKEITVEINPETASKEYLSQLKSAGITRVSLGIQTFNNRLLNFIGRNHTEKEAINSLENALSIFNNVSADLMFALPNQTEKSLLNDLEILTSFKELKHISIYGFTLYENTPIYKRKESLNIPDENRFSKFYKLIVKFLKEKKFLHYEISNFSKQNYECKHNLSYWFLKKYIGVGPSAASFIDGVYYKNVENLTVYSEKIKNCNLPCEITPFSFNELLEIKLGMGLRTIYGVRLNYQELEIVEKAIMKSEILQTFLKEEIITFEKNVLRLNPEYFHIFNFIVGKIASEIWNV
ncbi:radical SAM family heme chaperone HemW [Desulfurobacterium atlanticum]|uniref:Heme chaperone HemW n=1 Tax=Desulfurobacterium atlanticum TaxID=240169 RepID=A0A238XZU1_9BACT|nr:radical SAM family heme chaperone HemW [Desulfurobacterium atlanticum]SNR64417.1 coproporphyrinogen III oxidase, anaerobic [Desulfurobacterium atlanticum]